ncbi:hypothetical protein OAE56_00390 [Verrucomicrobiales bacterium]|nr:hypothetical protein [Verrucomicrobiales bacterium]
MAPLSSQLAKRLLATLFRIQSRATESPHSFESVESAAKREPRWVLVSRVGLEWVPPVLWPPE